jgi:two-component system cell cycle sensor histidine kinase PleC
MAPATQSNVITDNNQEYLTEAARLATADASDPAVAVLAYSLDEALAQYRAVFLPILVVLALALIPALGAALLIARGVSRPLEVLAAQARRIADGDYRVPAAIKQKGELSHLSEALGTMTTCIAQREAALNAAVASTEAARNEAVRANHAKSQFLANMSHELRTPLNAIVGFGEMLHQQVLGQLGNARYVEYARDICSSGQHLLGLVSRMLDLADLEKGSFIIGHEDFSPAQLLRESVSGLRAMAETGQVSLNVTDDDANWPTLTGDAQKLREAITSLLHNAIKFTPAGGTVQVSGGVSDSQLCIRIADTGVGMAAEDIANVVKPFHRLRSAFDGSQQGAGLGLPFAKAVVESHGGSLHIASKPGEGTSVEISLPLSTKSLSEAA